jgi:hypothetical protein
MIYFHHQCILINKRRTEEKRIEKNYIPGQASNQKNRRFNALKKILFCEKEASPYMLMFLNLFAFTKKIFFNAKKGALFTRKKVVFFVTCLTGNGYNEHNGHSWLKMYNDTIFCVQRHALTLIMPIMPSMSTRENECSFPSMSAREKECSFRKLIRFPKTY